MVRKSESNTTGLADGLPTGLFAAGDTSRTAGRQRDLYRQGKMAMAHLADTIHVIFAMILALEVVRRACLKPQEELLLWNG